MTTVNEFIYLHTRRRKFKRRRTGRAPLCVLCGSEIELISLAAAARCAGMSPEDLCRSLNHVHTPAASESQQGTFFCLDCLRNHQGTLLMSKSTE